MSSSDYPILGVKKSRVKKRFKQPLLTSKPATLTQSAQTTIPTNSYKALGLSRSKIKW